MLKIIKVTYGTHGNTKEYTYLTNKDVRNGTVIQPSVKHYKSGKIFGTTGVVQHNYKLTSKQGKEELDSLKGKTLVPVKTAGELGIGRDRQDMGKFASTGIHKTYKSSSGKWAVPDNVEFVKTSYIEAVRQGNVESRESGEGTMTIKRDEPQGDKE